MYWIFKSIIRNNKTLETIYLQIANIKQRKVISCEFHMLFISSM